MVNSESRKKAETKFEKFAQLYQQYRAGRKWLEARLAAGSNCETDLDDFFAHVVNPLDALLVSMGAQERAAADLVMRTYDQMRGKRVTFYPTAEQRSLEI